jgi:hypothetical protein
VTAFLQRFAHDDRRHSEHADELGEEEREAQAHRAVGLRQPDVST